MSAFNNSNILPELSSPQGTSVSFLVNIALAFYAFNTYILLPFVTPVLLGLGIVNNILVLRVFLPNGAKAIGLSESLKIYYMVLAAADLFSLLTSHLWDFMGFILNYDMI